MNIIDVFLAWLDSTYSVFATALLIVIVEVVFRVLRARWRATMEERLAQAQPLEGNEMEYYKKIQLLYMIRVGTIVVCVIALLVGNFPSLGSLFAIAAGAIMLIFGSYILSFVTYFNLLTLLTVGDTIKIGEQYKGEVIKIRPLYLVLTGKNDTGDHTGELIRIPNHKVWNREVINVDLGLQNYQKIVITIPFIKEHFACSFETFSQALHDYLSGLFPVTTSAKAEHFKSYIGYRYKWSLKYNENGVPVITVGCICLLKNAAQKQYQIISFVERCKEGIPESPVGTYVVPSGNDQTLAMDDKERHHKKLLSR